MEGQWQSVQCRVRKVVYDFVGMKGKPLERVTCRRYDCILVENDLPASLEGIMSVPGYARLCQILPELGIMNVIYTTLRMHAETLMSGKRLVGMAGDVLHVLCVVESVPKYEAEGVTYVVELFDKPLTVITKVSLFPSPL